MGVRLCFPGLVTYRLWVGLLPSRSRQRPISVGPPADDSGLHGLGVGNDFRTRGRVAGFYLLPVLLSVGAGSVVLWWYSEARGVEIFGSTRRCRCTRCSFCPFCFCYRLVTRVAAILGWCLAFTCLRKSSRARIDRLSSFDHHTISGHTLKHLAAGAAGILDFANAAEARSPSSELRTP